jgi:hypothetical protein
MTLIPIPSITIIYPTLTPTRTPTRTLRPTSSPSPTATPGIIEATTSSTWILVILVNLDPCNFSEPVVDYSSCWIVFLLQATRNGLTTIRSGFDTKNIE